MNLMTALNMPESRTRSLAKALSRRITATLATAFTAYIATREMDTALMIDSFEFILKFIIY